ncbi:LOW QUALITY PROTEIN: Nuclear RNA export factor 2, partial [Galemys pyrenaicus]
MNEEHSEYGAHSSTFQEKNGREDTKIGQEDPEVRHSACNIQQNKRSVKWHDEDSIHINMWTDKKPAETEMSENPPDGTPANWFRITIPNGMKYDKTWLINLLRNHCNAPFIPVDFHYVKTRARFFIQDSRAASVLMDESNKIYDEEKQEICVMVKKSAEPFSEWNMLEAEELEKLEIFVITAPENGSLQFSLQAAMKKRYDGSRKALDLQRLRLDPGLLGHEINIILNRRSCMSSIVRTIKKNFPELLSLNLCDNKLYRLDGLSDIVQMVPTIKSLNLSQNELKSTWEVCKMKGLRLEELWLEGNPLCDNFSHQSYYVRSVGIPHQLAFRRSKGPSHLSPSVLRGLLSLLAVRACFPTLLRLDGKELPPPGAVRNTACNLVKFCEETYKGSETLKDLVLEFLQRYYRIYDYGDRKSFLSVYHEEACFCLAIPFVLEDAPPISFKENRNMTKMKDQYLRCELVKHKRHDIVKTLCLLPQTQHDLNSFVVDMWIETVSTHCFLGPAGKATAGWEVSGDRAPGRFPFRKLKSAFLSRGCSKNESGKNLAAEGRGRRRVMLVLLVQLPQGLLCLVNDEMVVRDAFQDEISSVFSTSLPPATSSFTPSRPQGRERAQALSLPSKMNQKGSQNDGGSSPQGRKKDYSSFGDRGDKSDTSEYSEYGAQSSHFQEENGHEEMRDGQADPEARHTPYNINGNKRRVRWQNEDHIHITVWREKNLGEKEAKEKTPEKNIRDWFKVTILNGIKYEKTWLMNLLRSHCNVPFIPVDKTVTQMSGDREGGWVGSSLSRKFLPPQNDCCTHLLQFHYVKNRARFFIQDASAAYALKDVSYKIYDEENQKIYIVVTKSAEPYSVQNMLEPEKMELLELDGLSDIVQMVPTVKSLNLSRNMVRTGSQSRVWSEEGWCLQLTWEVGKMKELNLEELWLDGNPLCDTFPNRSSYVRSVGNPCHLSGNLNSPNRASPQDGKELPPLVVVDIDHPYFTKPCKKISKDSETLKDVVLQFLQQYYSFYDCGDRKSLLDVYHEESCFSLTIPFNPEDPAPRSMWLYLKDSRNMKDLMDPYLRNRLLRHTSHDIVKTLCMLPQTQHDLSSFLVDMWVRTVSTRFPPQAGPESHRKACSASLSTGCSRNEGLHTLFVPSPELSSSSLATVTTCWEAGTVGGWGDRKHTLRGRGTSRTLLGIVCLSSCLRVHFSSSFCIVNDELFVRDATPNETQRAFSTPPPRAISGSVLIIPQKQQEMVHAFSSQSGMNLAWSQ